MPSDGWGYDLSPVKILWIHVVFLLFANDKKQNLHEEGEIGLLTKSILSLAKLAQYIRQVRINI
jgi:hypothetical protein